MIILNMIVKNEAPRILRALRSTETVIGAMAILDTGSTDDTMELIGAYCLENAIPLVLHSAPFRDFSTSRNEALAMAKDFAKPGDYILLMDADMELRWPLDIPMALTAPAYRVLQRHEGGLTYWNTRLIAAGATAMYVGVTHEYLDLGPGVGPPQALEGPWFIDHSDGGNRPGKFTRDIALLEAALSADPDDARSTFYLAQSHRDAATMGEGNPAAHLEAARSLYAQRAGMGGWEEERWRAQLELGRLMADDSSLIVAFNQRPTRAEPLWDLAVRHNARHMWASAALYASWGLTVPRPKDILFVEDAIYEWGLRQEFSIGANYHPDPQVKALGAKVCDELSLDRGVPDGVRWLAHSNNHFYIQSAAQMFPSWQTSPLMPARVPDGYAPMAPSLCQHKDALWSTLRMVNYEAGETAVTFTPRDGTSVIRTENHLCQLARDGTAFVVTKQIPILLPEDWPEPVCTSVRGLEDLRLVSDGDDLWVSGNTREFSPAPNGHGWCQMVQARLVIHDDHARMVDWRVISAVPPNRHEKNWMPFAGFHSRHLYLCDPTILVGPNGPTASSPVPPIHAERFRGSTQFIPYFRDWLGVIHEVEWRSGFSYYRSRFIELDKSLHLRRVSRPFYFQNHGLEIAMGLAWGPASSVLVGYSFKERSPHIGTLSLSDVNNALGAPL